MSRAKQNILIYLKEFKNRFYYQIILLIIDEQPWYRKNNDIKNLCFNMRAHWLFTTKITVQKSRDFNCILSSN